MNTRINQFQVLIVEAEGDVYKKALEALVPEAAFELCDPQQVVDNLNADLLIADPVGAAKFFRSGGRVPWVQSTWAGVEPLVEVAREHNILVTGIKGVFGPLVSQYVFAHILAKSQHLEHFSAAQTKCQWQPRTPQSLFGKTMLVLGAGDIGRHVGQTARQFSMRVLGITKNGTELPEFDHVYSGSKLDRVISHADYIVVCLPDTPSTSGIINEKILRLCKVGACLINVGRASSVVTRDLVKALNSGFLKRAIVDVFDEEPLQARSSLWQVSNLLITPHIAAVSTVSALIPVIAENLKRRQTGQSLKFVVNLARGY